MSTLWEAQPQKDGSKDKERIPIHMGPPVPATAAVATGGHVPDGIQLAQVVGELGESRPKLSEEDSGRDLRSEMEDCQEMSRRRQCRKLRRVPQTPHRPRTTKMAAANHCARPRVYQGEVSQKEIKTTRREKWKRRHERRRGKIDNRAQETEADGGAEVGEEEAPFDYSTARSVLHAQRASENGTKGKKFFDPYVSKATADGPKGARRMHSERTGKTATFKK